LKEGYLLSFFSSGFASHVRGKAIDIGSVDIDVFYSPVDGVVESVEVVEIGRPNRRAERSYDVVTLIRTADMGFLVRCSLGVKAKSNNCCQD